MTEAVANTFTRPWMPAAWLAMSRSMRLALSSMLRACSSKVSPAGVGTTPCLRRVSRFVPTVASSWASRLLTAEATMLAFSAARLMLPVSQTITNSRSEVRSRSRIEVFQMGTNKLPKLNCMIDWNY